MPEISLQFNISREEAVMESLNLKEQNKKALEREQRVIIKENLEYMKHVAEHGSPFIARNAQRNSNIFLLIILVVITSFVCWILFVPLGLGKYFATAPSPSGGQAPQSAPTQGNSAGSQGLPTQAPTPFPTMMVIQSTVQPTQIISAPAGTMGYIDPLWPTTSLMTNSNDNHPLNVTSVNLSAIPLYEGIVRRSSLQVLCQYGVAYLYVGPGFSEVVALTTSTNPQSITIRTPYEWPGNATVLCPEDALIIVYGIP